jgi:hypothetical protein
MASINDPPQKAMLQNQEYQDDREAISHFWFFVVPYACRTGSMDSPGMRNGFPTILILSMQKTMYTRL